MNFLALTFQFQWKESIAICVKLQKLFLPIWELGSNFRLHFFPSIMNKEHPKIQNNLRVTTEKICLQAYTQSTFTCSKLKIGLVASFWCLHCYLHYFLPCSNVSIVNFEHAIADWDTGIIERDTVHILTKLTNNEMLGRVWR